MRLYYALSVLLCTAFHAAATPQGVTSSIAPQQSSPPGCSPNYDGSFEVSTQNASTTGKMMKRQSTLSVTLKNGVLKDNMGRTGYVTATDQFQFDDPPQNGAIYTAGFSVCQDGGTIAIGSSIIWYECASAGSSFYNLYLTTQSGSTCSPAYLVALPLNGSTSSTTTGTPTSTGSTISSTATSTTAPGAAATSNSSKTSGGSTSSAVKIGIGVGVGVGVPLLLLIAALSFFCVRRRSSKESGPYKSEPGELSAQEQKHELGGRGQVPELGAGKGQVPELPVQENPQELPTERL